MAFNLFLFSYRNLRGPSVSFLQIVAAGTVETITKKPKKPKRGKEKQIILHQGRESARGKEIKGNGGKTFQHTDMHGDILLI